MNKIFCFFFIFISFFSVAQREHHADINYYFTKDGLALSGNAVKNFKLLKSEKLHLGVGARGGFYNGKNLLYYTAPAKYNKNEDGIDTLKVDKTLFVSVSLSLNASYHFNNNWSIGGNIDAIGFTFGNKQNSSFFPSKLSQNEDPPRLASNNQQVKPTSNNFFMLGNYSKGTLYSEIFIRYRYKSRYSLKLGYSSITTEYSSKVKVGHSNNYRFRNTSGQLMLGFGYSFI